MGEFTRRLGEGQVGEGKVARWLRDLGWNVLPAYGVEVGSGKGPRLFTATAGELVAPDLLVFNRERVMWAEVKTKSSFTWHRTTQTWQDGIDLRHWLEYLKVADVSGWDVWLLFLHESADTPAKDTPMGMSPPVGLFGNSVGVLRDVVDHVWESGNMIYWSIEDLKLIATSNITFIDLLRARCHKQSSAVRYRLGLVGQG